MNSKLGKGVAAVCLVCCVTGALADPRPLQHLHLGGSFSHPPFQPTSLVLYHDMVYDDSSPDSHATSLDIYTADPVGTSSPVLVYVHGGGYAVGDKAWSKDLDPKPEYFTQTLGYVFISINYRLLPEGRYPVNVQDMANAIAWVHDNITDFGGDPEHIVIMGHSAGAGLVAQVATEQRFLINAGKHLSSLRGVIAIDGSSYDLTQSEEREAILIERYGRDWQQASPLAHVAPDEGIPPFLFLHVTGEVGPRTQSEWQSNVMATALRAAGVRADVVALSHVEHFGANERMGQPDDPTTLAVERFLRMLKPAADQSSAPGSARGSE